MARTLTAAFASFLGFGLTACASYAPDMDSVATGGRVSTLGFGVEASARLSERFHLRGAYTDAEVNLDQDMGEFDAKLSIDLGVAGGQLDYYPFRRGPYLTGGVFANDVGASLRTVDGTTIEINGNTYDTADVGNLTAEADFGEVATFVGAGLAGRMPRTPLEGFIEGGVLLQQDPQITYSVDGALANDPVLLADLDAEAAEAEDDLSIAAVFPTITLGLRLRF